MERCILFRLQNIFNEKASAAITIFEKITNYKIILNNSYQLKYYLNNVSYHFANREVFQRTADVKQLYPTLEIADCKVAVTWLFRFIGYYEDITTGMFPTDVV